MPTLCHPPQSAPTTFTPDQRLALFLMSAPRSVSQVVLAYLSLERVAHVAACRALLPGMTNEDRRVIQENAARALGVTSDGLAVIFCKRPRWSVSMLEFWAARGSYQGGNPGSFAA